MGDLWHEELEREKSQQRRKQRCFWEGVLGGLILVAMEHFLCGDGTSLWQSLAIATLVYGLRFIESFGSGWHAELFKSGIYAYGGMLVVVVAYLLGVRLY